MTSAITTRGLTKHYGTRRTPGRPAKVIEALTELDLEISEGEVFGFLGPNGAGKTTMIRLLLGYLHPSGGSASVLGFDTEREGLAIRARVGYLPGGIALYDTMSGEDLLDYLCRLYRRAPSRRAALADRLEMSAATLRRPVRDYSRGMRQKIGIIQALQHDPELAILDEPTEGLDPLMQRAFYELLAEIKHDGRTIFFSSHILSEVERVCDRVAIIRQGRLLAVQNIDELQARKIRILNLKFEHPLDATTLPLPHATLRSQEGLSASFAYAGTARELLAALSGLPLADFTLENARLEEIFLGYYEHQAP